MAQISIPMSNKVGYSMYWNSMWDSKINFSRALKEDIYLKSFIPLIFDDNISNKILKTYSFENLLKKKILTKYNLHLKTNNLKKNLFYKYILNLNKMIFFGSKVWVLKYQKWVIIYFFMYFPKFSDLKNNQKVKERYSTNNDNNSINNLFSLYKTVTIKLKYSYNFFNNSINKNLF